MVLKTSNLISPYYGWYLELLEDMARGDRLRLQETNCLSARKNLKTTQASVFSALSTLVTQATNQRVAIYVGRLNAKNIPEIVAEVRKGLTWCGLEQGKHYEFKWGRSRPEFTFGNGSFIKCYSAKQSDSNVVNLKGLADAQCDYLIDWIDEATEFSKDDRTAVSTAMRGFKKGIIHIRTANPDNDELEYVRYCSARLKHDKSVLETEHHQQKRFVENGISKLIQYNSYHINPHLQPEEIAEFEDWKENDYPKYMAWALGLPIGLGEYVFTYYLNKLSSNDTFRPTYFTSGIDLGMADTPQGHPTVVELVGVNEQMHVKGIGEYYHNNAEMTHKDTYQLARDIIIAYQQWGHQFPLMRQGHVAYVDYGWGGQMMTDVLNHEKDALGIDWLDFVPVEKKVWKVKDRIDGFIWLMANKSYFLDPLLTPALAKSLHLLRWRKAPPTDQTPWKPEPVDRDDDAFDAQSYAIMSILKEAVANAKKGRENNQPIHVWQKVPGDDYDFTPYDKEGV